MITLDTIKLKIYDPNGIGYDPTKYDTHIKNPGQEDSTTIRVIKKEDRKVGLNYIEICDPPTTAIVTTSAKILHADYFQGINISNIEKVIDKINSYNIVNITPDMLASSDTLSCDVTTNMQVANVREYVDALKLGKSNSGFIVSDYNDARNNGIVFQGRQISYKNRMIYYNKGVELLRSCNRDFLELCGDSSKFFGMFDKVLRIEQNITSFDRIRKGFKIKDNKLFSVLESSANPLFDRHQIIMQHVNNVSLFDIYNDEPDIKKIVYNEGFRGIYEQCNASFELALDFLKSKMNRSNREKVTTHINMFKEWYCSYLEKLDVDNRVINDNKYFNILSEIREYLKVA